MFEALLTVDIVSTVGLVGGKASAAVVDNVLSDERPLVKFQRRVKLDRARRASEVVNRG